MLCLTATCSSSSPSLSSVSPDDLVARRLFLKAVLALNLDLTRALVRRTRLVLEHAHQAVIVEV